MSRETELRKQLHELNLEYRQRAKPIIDELVAIENAKPPKPVIFDPASFILQPGAKRGVTPDRASDLSANDRQCRERP